MKTYSSIVITVLITASLCSCVVNRKTVGTTTPPKRESWKANKQVCPTCGDKEKKSSILENRHRELK